MSGVAQRRPGKPAPILPCFARRPTYGFVKRDHQDAKSTLVGPRNFSLDTQARLRALVAGPPAFVLRRRRIEDLEVSLVRKIAAYEAKAGAPLDAASLPRAIAIELASLERLVRVHNEWFPVEASLPVDIATGEYMHLG